VRLPSLNILPVAELGEAQAVVPSSARVIASVGNEQNVLLMLTVEAAFGAGPVTLPAARLYLLDEDEKIKAEQIMFFAAPS
jgi:hypothetical protein